MNEAVVLAESGSSTLNIGDVMTSFANSAISGITDTVTALVPVITLTVVIGVAIKMFKKYVKA